MDETASANKKKPGRWVYGLGAAFLILAVLALIPGPALLVSEFMREKVGRGTVPGSFEVTFDEPGEYVLFYEHRSELDGERYNTQMPPPQFDVTMETEGRDASVSLQPWNNDYSYETPRYAGTAIRELKIDEADTYTVTAEPTADREDGPFVLAVGRASLAQMVGGVLGTFAGCGAFFLFGVAGIVTLVVGFVKRR